VTRRQIAEGCIRACWLVISSAGRYVAVSMDDIPFLQMVEQWLRVQGLIEQADDIARCIDLYQHAYQNYLQAMSSKESVLESKRENNNLSE